jgi:putative lipoic acid-binding regulatory protein
MTEPPPSLIEYPCDFPLKVMGAQVDGFVDAVVAVARSLAPDFDPSTIETRASAGGRYVSVTLTVRATSRAQLDELYRALSAHPLVKVVL